MSPETVPSPNIAWIKEADAKRLEQSRKPLQLWVFARDPSDVSGSPYVALSAAPAPIPSPAAKGGEAVRDHAWWLAVAKAAGEAGVRYRTNRALCEFLDTVAALATPSPQPADAVRERIARALNSVLGSEEDEHPRHHPTQNSWEKPSEVWWTQWLEAADAVVAALASDPAPAREAVEPEGPFIVMSSNYSRPFLLGCYETLAQAVTAQCGSPEKWDIFTRHPAPAGEAVEPLEDRIDNAVQAMSETHHSWESRCHAIMAALGFNFGWSDLKCDEDPATSNNARLREDLGQAESDKAILYTKLQDAERERDDAREALETATDDRERLVAIIELFVSRIERNGSWDDGCFYFSGKAASELERPLNMARATLATETSR